MVSIWDASWWDSQVKKTTTPTTTTTTTSTLPNTLTTNATKTSSQITQETLASTNYFGNDDLSNLVGGAYNTINGTAIPTSGTNDPSMFTQPVGDGLTTAQRSAKYNSPTTSTTAPAATTVDPMAAISQAYSDALRAGSKQAMQNQRDAVAAAFQGNIIQNQLNKNLTDLISASQAQAQQSSDILNKTLATISSGNKGAQTGLEAVDVSEQMAKEDASRRKLRQSSVADTKKAGLLSQKAMLSKPTLLGL